MKKEITSFLKYGTIFLIGIIAGYIIHAQITTTCFFKNMSRQSRDKKLSIALKAFYDGRYEETISLAEEVLAENDTDALAWKRLGSAYYALGDIKKANLYWERSIKYDSSDEILKSFVRKIKAEKLKPFKNIKGMEFLPGIPIRSEYGKKAKGGDVEIPVYSEAQSRLFGRAFESYLTGKYDQALILSRRLYKSAPDDKRIKSLYYKSLEKLIIAHEEKEDYRIALNYIKEAEKIDNGQRLKEIKTRIEQAIMDRVHVEK
ncbi:MAG: tetratricopeptide repeat protein [Elusimicrobiota bacterium]|nr:tetratricopeptide repeat protein [Elusimicrobiota bacterium]